MDETLLLILLFALGFIGGVTFTAVRIRNKIKDILDELRFHYKTIDEEQYKFMCEKYGVTKDTWMEKGIKNIKKRRKEKSENV